MSSRMSNTEILYNGRCPICSAEIAHYRVQAEKVRAPLTFTDLNEADLSDWALSKDQATRRIHARKDGQIISGFPAFLILWRDLPRMRWLVRLMSLPVLRQIADIGYNYLAAPLLYRLHLWREAKRS